MVCPSVVETALLIRLVFDEESCVLCIIKLFDLVSVVKDVPHVLFLLTFCDGVSESFLRI